MVIVLLASYLLLRKVPQLIRPAIEPQTILVNPSAKCALIEYAFRGGERWSWLHPYALFTLSDGDAFYTSLTCAPRKS